VGLLARLGLCAMIAPRTRGWAGARAALEEYVDERRTAQRHALGLDSPASRSQDVS